MKNNFLVVWTWLVVFAVTPAHAADGWELVWSDDFNEPGLPDPVKWDYEEGFVRNGEKQFYARARKENARGKRDADSRSAPGTFRRSRRCQGPRFCRVHVGHDPNLIDSTSHYPLNGKHASDGGHLQAELSRGDFHVYAVNWTSDKIEYFVDDRLNHTTTIDHAGQGEDHPFRRPQYLLLNFALGGQWGGPIDDGILPQRYVIDYVRVFKKKE